MKKLISIIMAVIAAAVFLIAGCKDDGGGNPSVVTDPVIRLRSDAEVEMNVGETTNIVYSTVNTDSAVLFASADESVVTVDKYASVTAVGVGTTTVTLSLEDYPDIKQTVTFKVSKTFFMKDNGYKNGLLDLNGQETGGAVYVKDGQAQLLVNAAGEEWYFKCHIERTGYTSGDMSGGWGVGSFLVDSAHEIGDTMFWYALRHSGDGFARLFYGGWRYDSTVSASREEPVDEEDHTVSGGVDLTVIRYGITHYFIAELSDGTVIKHSYDVPLFKGKSTFPGVFGQNQKLTVTDYESSNDKNTVYEKLSKFQLAESVCINVLDSRLIAGETYRLTSTVLPELTFDKAVSYSLLSGEGVTLSADGTLVVSASARGEVTVEATASSNPAAKATQTYTVIERPQSTSDLFDTGMAFGADVNFTESGFTASGTGYVPLNLSGEKWSVTATVDNVSGTIINNSEIGVMSASAGYTRYAGAAVSYRLSKQANLIYSELNGTSATLSDAANGALSGLKNRLGLVRNGSDLYLFINGRLIKKFTADMGGNSVPVIYFKDIDAKITEVEATTDSETIDNLLADYPFYVGSKVSVDGNSYTFAAKDYGSANDMNWPPVNDYDNGLKFAREASGDYAISFTLSDVKPYQKANGEIDAKILVYLKSESTSCSLQFVIKKTATGETVTSFCPNFDDATWTEYALPDGVNLLTGPTSVRIVKNSAGVELYLNGERVFEGESFMTNSGYWSDTTSGTPGIATFLCGATVTDPEITLN